MPPMSGTWLPTSTPAAGAVNGTSIGRPVPVVGAPGASTQSPSTPVQSAIAQGKGPGSVGPATSHSTFADSPGVTTARPGSAATWTRAPITRVAVSSEATGRSLLQPATAAAAASNPIQLPMRFMFVSLV